MFMIYMNIHNYLCMYACIWRICMQRIEKREEKEELRGCPLFLFEVWSIITREGYSTMVASFAAL